MREQAYALGAMFQFLMVRLKEREEAARNRAFQRFNSLWYD